MGGAGAPAYTFLRKMGSIWSGQVGRALPDEVEVVLGRVELVPELFVESFQYRLHPASVLQQEVQVRDHLRALVIRLLGSISLVGEATAKCTYLPASLIDVDRG